MPRWFNLNGPTDLLKKLRHDCARVEKDPADSCAAFDFFVTAFHLLDWTYPGDKNAAARRSELAATPLLRISQHIANGVKHLHLDDPRLNSVAGTATVGVFDKTFDRTFDRSRLILQLDGVAAQSYGPTVSVAKLAPEIVVWWERKLSSNC